MKKITLFIFLLTFSLGYAQPTSIPADPTNNPIDVISIYGSTFTNVATNYNPNWGQSGLWACLQSLHAPKARTGFEARHFSYKNNEAPLCAARRGVQN